MLYNSFLIENKTETKFKDNTNFRKSLKEALKPNI